MDIVNVKILNKSKNPNPKYATSGSAAMDLYANIDKSIILKPLDRVLIPTGIFIELEKGYEAQIRSRSGLALKKGLIVLNSPGTIDSDYRGEIGVILINLSNVDVLIEPNERVAQMVVVPYSYVEWTNVDKLSDSNRADGAFGHTGTK